MTTACIFCDIVNHRAPAKIVREWATCVAFVPLNPVIAGHVLVVPREHVNDALEDQLVTAITMAKAAEYASENLPSSCNLITSAGKAATQTVFHLHVHVIPRRVGDGLHLPWTGQEIGEDL